MLENLNQQLEEAKALANQGNNSFKFSYEQISAIQSLISFTNKKISKYDEDTAIMCLTGSAGTGKSSVISQYISYLENKHYDYGICAPTHKAKTVIEKMSKLKAYTLHEILSLQPNLDIFELNLKELEFKTCKNKLYLPSLLIIDECSMINDELFDYIVKDIVKKYRVRVISVGDSAQLQPVNGITISKVFEVKNKISLTKVFRQDSNSALTPILSELRERPIYSQFKDSISSNGSLYTCNDTKKFVIECAKSIKKTILSGNPLTSKIACYTNNRVDEYNDIIRKILFKNSDSEYNNGEILTANDTYSGVDLISTSGKTDEKDHKIYNSTDYIVMRSSRYTRKADDIINFDIPGYYLLIKDSINDNTYMLFVMSRFCDQSIKNKLSVLLESIRRKAVKLKGDVSKRKQSAILWKKYFTIQDSIAVPFDLYYDNNLIKKATLKYGYASTVHRLQGSTFNEILIDMGDIMKCYNKDELRQLQYVALSRTKGDVKLLNK